MESETCSVSGGVEKIGSDGFDLKLTLQGHKGELLRFVSVKSHQHLFWSLSLQSCCLCLQPINRWETKRKCLFCFFKH